MTDMMPMRRSKAAVRRSVKQSILTMGAAARAREEVELVARFPKLPGYSDAQTVLLYVKAFPEEIGTDPLFERAMAAGKRVLCPRVEPAGLFLRLFMIESLTQDLEPGVLGIPEPRKICPEVNIAEVDWALVPGLAFDARCYRLGRGAGYYDRLLPKLRPGVFRWALALTCQIVPEVPVEPHDVPIDGVVTCTELHARYGHRDSATVP